jgi:hypothetical protein
MGDIYQQVQFAFRHRTHVCKRTREDTNTLCIDRPFYKTQRSQYMKIRRRAHMSCLPIIICKTQVIARDYVDGDYVMEARIWGWAASQHAEHPPSLRGLQNIVEGLVRTMYSPHHLFLNAGE